MHQARHYVLVLATALLLHGAAAGGLPERVGRALAGFGGRIGGGGGGFSSRPVTYRPATAPPRSAQMSGRPFGSAAAGPRPPGAAAATGPRPASAGLAGGAAYAGARRPGFASTPFLLPFGAGLLAGTAASSLARSSSAYCNGGSITCYRQACEAALADRCPDAAAASNGTLVLTRCPSGQRFSECYKTPDAGGAAAAFECFGARRPRFGNDDVSAVCHQPAAGGSLGNGATGGRAQQAPLLGAAAAALLAALALL